MASESSNRPLRLQLAGGTGTFERADMSPVPPPVIPRSKFSVAVFLGAVAISALWGGGAGGYLLGWFSGHGLTNISLQEWAIFGVVTFVPPLLFLALAWAIVRGQAMGEATRIFADATDKIFAADDTATQTAQRIGRAVRHELDALNTGLDTAYNRMRILEGQITEQISALDTAGDQLRMRGDTISQQLAEGRGEIDKSADALNAVAAQIGRDVATSLHQAEAEIQTSAEDLRRIAAAAGADVAGQLEAAKGDISDSANILRAMATKTGTDVAAQFRAAEAGMAASAEGLSKVATQAASDVAGQMKAAEDGIHATTNALHTAAAEAGAAMAAQLEDTRKAFRSLSEELSTSAMRTGESVSGRVAQLRLTIASAGKVLEDAAGRLDRESGNFREAVNRAAEIPSETSRALGEQIQRMESISEAAMTRAEDVLARQDRQRQAMSDMLSQMKNDSLAIEGRIAAERQAMEKVLATLDSESKRFTALAGESERRIDAIMAAATARTQELARTFAREARGLRDSSSDAGDTISGMIAELREAGETAKSLIGDAAGWAKGQTGELVDNASRECNRLLETAGALAEETKALQAALANSVEDVEKHLTLLPDVAQEEAAKIRETVRKETEQMLDQSARAMATLHARNTRAPAGTARTLPPEEQMGLELLKRQIGITPDTASTAPRQPAQSRQPAPARQTAPVGQTAPVKQTGAEPQIRLRPTGNLRDAIPRLSTASSAAKSAPAPTGRAFRPPVSGMAPTRTKTKDWEMHSLLAAADKSAPPDRSTATGALQTLEGVLADMAVDLDAIAGDQGPQMKEWRRYLDGDHGVFARKLAAAIDGETVHRIAMLYREDPHFRESADAYMAEFETLLKDVRSGSSGSLLATTLLSADTGKIYLAVAYALGRL